MLDLIDVMQWTGLTTLAVVVYVMIFSTKANEKRIGPYSVPSWNFHLKKWWAKRVLRKRALSEDQKAVDFQNFNSEQSNGDTLQHSSQFIYGTDTDGNSMIISLAIGKDGSTELWMKLCLADGGSFALPAHPKVHSTKIGNINENRFEVAGVLFQCLEPYVKWRISYAGLLRKLDEPDSDDDLHFVRFNFFWTMCTAPQHWPADWSDDLKAGALAAERWRQPNWWEYLSISGYGGFDQFGTLFGQVHLNGSGADANESHTSELNMPGVRQRRWSSYEPDNIRRCATIVGVCADGSVFVMGAFSLKRNLSHAQFGYVRSSDGLVSSIDSTDFHLNQYAERPNHIPKVVNITFSANHRTFTSQVYAQTDEILQMRGSTPTAWIENVLRGEIGLNGSHGFGVVRLWYPSDYFPQEGSRLSMKIGRENSSQSMPPLFLMGSQQRPTRTKIAYWFTDAGAQSEAIAGGKGASLAMLTAAMLDENKVENENRFRVPDGFVLSVSAYQLQVDQHPEIRQAIARIRTIAYAVEAKPMDELKAACDAVIEIFENAVDLEPQIEQIVAKYVRDLKAKCGDGIRFAVRSSAIGEDGEDTSAAGQNETLLGVQTSADILLAVRKCWASLYTHRSVEYRRQHLMPIASQMAVVVQVMVASEVAGVMFTRDPSSGDPRKLLITANYGLGESVVSGTVDPDSFIVAKKRKNVADARMNIIETYLGTKNHSIRMSDSVGGTIIVADPKSDGVQHRVACITDEQVLRLASIGVRLEKMYGNARDIEWATYENEFYILQSRPITTTNTMSNWELLHELDTAVMSTDNMYTFANIGEVLPDCVTPLTGTTVIQSLQSATMKIVRSSLPYGGRFLAAFARTHHRVMFDIYEIILVQRQQNISLADKILAYAIAGNDYITPEIHRVSVQRHGFQSGRQILAELLSTTVQLWYNKTIVEQLERFMGKLAGRFSDATKLQREFDGFNADQFAAEIDFELDDVDRMETALNTHSKVTKVSTFSQIITLLVLAEGADDLSATHLTDIGLILSTCNDVESAEVPNMLEEIANEIYLAGVMDEFLALAPEDGAKWLSMRCAAAGRMLNNFISRHGHRAIKEFELVSITWAMQPTLVISMVQSLCSNVFRSDALLLNKTRRSRLTNEQIVQQLRTPTRPLTRRIVGWLLSLCQKCVQRRETSKSQLIAYVHEMRMAYRHLAKLLVQKGLLPDAQLIFYLTRGELARLMRPARAVGFSANKTALVTKAQRRMRLFPSWNALRFDELNAYLAKPTSATSSSAAAEAADEQSGSTRIVVRGTSVSEGLVKGRACVVDSFADVGQLQAGDILVTHCTDIAWSPYFPMLGGVVTELGGLISHGAVVAREYGLPCIVGATNATQRLIDGEMCTLDATKGEVFAIRSIVVDGES